MKRIMKRIPMNGPKEDTEFEIPKEAEEIAYQYYIDNPNRPDINNMEEFLEAFVQEFISRILTAEAMGEPSDLMTIIKSFGPEDD